MNRRLMLHAGGGSANALAAIVAHLRGARTAVIARISVSTPAGDPWLAG